MDIHKLNSMYEDLLVKLPLTDSESALILAIEKNVIIIHDTLENEWSESIQKMLNDLIKALKLDSDQVSLHHVKTSISLHQFDAHLNDKHLIVFGISPKNLGLQISPVHHIVNRFSSFTLMLSYSLSELLSHPNKKRELWVALKEQFDLK